MESRQRRWTLCGFYTLLITVLSVMSMPDMDTPELIPHLDKAAHFLAYGVYAGLLLWAIRPENRIKALYLGGVIIYCGLYGVGMEFIQRVFRAGIRSYSIADMIANASGALVFAAGSSFFMQTGD